MKRQAQSLLIVGALLMAGYAPLVAHAMDPAAIENARTRADHKALAERYEQEAEALRQKEEQHRKILAAYEKSGGYEATKGGMIQHCNYLIRKYHELVEENLAMAKMHRQAMAEASQ
jgi:hypothetical protein